MFVLYKHLDRPSAVAVLRTESDRMPQVLISQASTDLRRTQSESQLAVKALDSISISSSVSGGTEDEMLAVYTLSSIGSGEKFMPSFDVADIGDLNGTLDSCLSTPRTKDDTLTPGMTMSSLEGTPAAALLQQPTAANDHVGENLGSFSSLLSLRTEDDPDDESGSGLSRSRPPSTRKQRLHVALQASKRKVLDLVQKRRPVTPSSYIDNVEVGADAGDMDGSANLNSESPTAAREKHSPMEVQVIDKKEKQRKIKNRSPVIHHPPTLTSRDSLAASFSGHSKSTKPVGFSENVLWGQSLHFDLDRATSSSPTKSSLKYLNITIHAKEVPTPSHSAAEPASLAGTQTLLQDASSVGTEPILLGYTSLYVPQILDDCQLTLSNCHREVYQLKPPNGVQSMHEASIADLSRHAGHDPRLCFGDVTVGFRYFPEGLPEGTNVVEAEESDEEMQIAERLETVKQDSTSALSSDPSTQHDWKPWSSKSGTTSCSMCRGKIWLKSATKCQRCFIVCHHKCIERAAVVLSCTPPSTLQGDAEFTELDVDVNEHRTDCPTSVIPETLQTTPAAPARSEAMHLTSRRTRLKNKMTEKFTSWRKGASAAARTDLETNSNRSSQLPNLVCDTAVEEELSSPIASIQGCLPDLLPKLDGSPFIRHLYFQPGNAYNEQTISHAKALGKEIFSNLKGEERKAKINEQIDRIQLAIRETKDGRLAAFKDEAEAKPGSTFEGLDERLQALAVLMLHYCAALQDCESQDREVETSVVHSSEAPPEESADSNLLSSASGNNEESPPHQPSVVMFEPSTPLPDQEEVTMTSASGELDQAFIVDDVSDVGLER
ncbi:hypothetical protein Q1695_007465 [Nippostrongylus brasiliensis]|nr:hypothetical protein Q1695_007465 [Nippostrongylus brasiliensis]